MKLRYIPKLTELLNLCVFLSSWEIGRPEIASEEPRRRVFFASIAERSSYSSSSTTSTASALFTCTSAKALVGIARSCETLERGERITDATEGRILVKKVKGGGKGHDVRFESTFSIKVVELEDLNWKFYSPPSDPHTLTEA